jgi:hypothetical protein
MKKDFFSDFFEKFSDFPVRRQKIKMASTSLGLRIRRKDGGGGKCGCAAFSSTP